MTPWLLAVSAFAFFYAPLRALPPERHPGRALTCAVGFDLSEESAAKAHFTERGVYTNPVRPTFTPGMIQLSVVSPSGDGWLSVPESPALHVVWDKDTCLSVEAPPTRRVCGRVEASVGVVNAVVVSAGDLTTGARPNKHGEFCVLTAPDTALRVTGRRDDGVISVVRKASWDPEAPGPALIFPIARQGGVGLIVTPVEGGLLRVEGTMAGMPASKAGLLPGELVRVESTELGDVGSVLHIERVLSAESVSLHRAVFDEPPGIPQLQDLDGTPFLGFWMPEGALAL